MEKGVSGGSYVLFVNLSYFLMSELLTSSTLCYYYNFLPSCFSNLLTFGHDFPP